MTATELKEYEAQYFEFTPHGFINFYFNDLVECWIKVVDDIIMTRLVDFATKPVEPEKVEALRSKLIGRLFQHGRLEILLNEGQKYLSNVVFKIPNSVTLPSDKSKLIAEYDEPAVMKKINCLSEEIVQLQLRLKKAEARKRVEAVKSALTKCLDAPEFADIRRLLENNDVENDGEDVSMEL